jgi:hypothetical protein
MSKHLFSHSGGPPLAGQVKRHQLRIRQRYDDAAIELVELNAKLAAAKARVKGLQQLLSGSVDVGGIDEDSLVEVQSEDEDLEHDDANSFEEEGADDERPPHKTKPVPKPISKSSARVKAAAKFADSAGLQSAKDESRIIAEFRAKRAGTLCELPEGLDQVHSSAPLALQSIVTWEASRGFDVKRATQGVKGANGETWVVACRRGCNQQAVEWRIRKERRDPATGHLKAPAYINRATRDHVCKRAAPAASPGGPAGGVQVDASGTAGKG